MDSFIFVNNYDTNRLMFKRNTHTKKFSGIYGIFCDKNQIVYIGASFNILQRLGAHKTHLKKGKHCNLHLQAVFNKYRELRFEILETFEEVKGESLLEAEINWIEKYKSSDSEWNCINMYIPVDTWKKDTTSYEYRQERLALYKKNLGKHKDRSWMKTPEHRKRMSDMFKGRECTWKENLLVARHKRPLQVYSMVYTVQTPTGEVEEVSTWESLKVFHKEWNLKHNIHFHKRGSAEKLVKEKECRGFKILKIVQNNSDGKSAVKYNHDNPIIK